MPEPEQPTNPQRGMGRGLAAILPRSKADEPGLRELAVELIKPNPRQPRRDFDEDALLALAESIRSRAASKASDAGRPGRMAALARASASCPTSTACRRRSGGAPPNHAARVRAAWYRWITPGTSTKTTSPAASRVSGRS